MSESEILKRAEELVHLIRDLDADVDETMKAVDAAPLEVRLAVHALLKLPRMQVTES